MTSTTYYNLNIVEGTDIVNPLVVDNPNYEKIDEAMHDNAVAGVTLATEITNATVHAITRENSDCAVIRFIATSEWKAGDTATVDGVPVTALLPSGETLPDRAYVINANVLCILTGTNLTFYLGKKNAENANEIPFNDTTVGAELVRLDGKVVRLDGEVVKLDGKIVKLDEKIANVNSNLNWKLLRTVTGKEAISLSDINYNELLIEVQRGTSDVRCNFNIAKSQLTSVVKTFVCGGYLDSSAHTQITININLSSVSILGVDFSGTSMTSTSTMSVYYR